jgi:predicted glutamine amidotransferase
MCRLLAAVASEVTHFRLTLKEAPRSLAFLSREHRDGWGIGVYSQRDGWLLQRGTDCAHDDEDFHEVAAGSCGEMLIAHVRKRTVGPITLENTHPFEKNGWVFAHNGTIEDIDWVRANVSPERLAGLGGQTDSEIFFAYLLSRLDMARIGSDGDGQATDEVLRRALDDLHARPKLGACNFILSNGRTLYAHRSGRTLYLLEKRPGDEVRIERASHETGAVVETQWSPARQAVLIASERITDEPWHEIEEGTLLRVDRLPLPAVREIQRRRVA